MTDKHHFHWLFFTTNVYTGYTVHLHAPSNK